MHEEDLCVWRCVWMDVCIYTFLGSLCISVSTSSPVPENLPALHHSRGLKQLRTHSCTQMRARYCITTHAQARATPPPPPPPPNPLPLPQCLLFIMHHELTPPVGTEEAERHDAAFLRTPRLRWTHLRGAAAELGWQQISLDPAEGGEKAALIRVPRKPAQIFYAGIYVGTSHIFKGKWKFFQDEIIYSLYI